MLRPILATAALWALALAELASAGSLRPASNIRSLDGSGNNLSHSTWGTAGSQLHRSAESSTSTGAYYPGDGSGATFYGGPADTTDIPNPRTISNRLYDDRGRSEPSRRNLSNMLWQWGQFLDHDITLTETSASPSEFAPIEVGARDPLSPMIPFERSNVFAGTGTSSSNPRQQINSITSFIDGSSVYGSDVIRAEAIRDTGNGGRLKTSLGNLLPYNTSGLPNAGETDSPFFLSGDVRANEQVGLTAMHTLFMREHNRLAGLLATNNPTWNDEELYQTSRKIVGAELQAITYREFLPALLGKRHANSLSPGNYSYDDSIDPTISNEFATSIYRFGHSMLPEELPLARVRHWQAGSLPLADAFFDPTFLESDATSGTHHLEQILLGLSRSVALEIDTTMVDAVRNFLFGSPGSGGMDLAALNIQRGREHGLPLYNEMRIAYGLSPATTFWDITREAKVSRRLKQLYGTVDKIDSWVGALAEEHIRGSSVGELTLTSMIKQFTALRDGDRFFFVGDSDLMANPAIDTVIDLDSITLSDILVFNTSLDHVPGNVFRANGAFPEVGCSFDGTIDGWSLLDGMTNLNSLRVRAIPEPSTWLLAAMTGLVGLLRRRTHRDSRLTEVHGLTSEPSALRTVVQLSLPEGGTRGYFFTRSSLRSIPRPGVSLP